MQTINEMLNERVEAELEAIQATDDISERKKLYGNLEAILKMANEQDKIVQNFMAEEERKQHDLAREEFEREKFEFEKSMAERDLEERKRVADKEHLGHLIGTIGGLTVTAVGYIFYNHWFKNGLQFEQDGTFCSTIVRSLFTKTPPKIG